MSAPLHPDTQARRPALAAAAAFFLLMTAYYIIRPVRDQFSGAVGSAALPRYFTYTLLAMLVLTPVFGYLVTRYSRRVLLVLSYGFFSLCLLAFIPCFGWNGGHGTATVGLVFFVWTSIFNLFVVALFWSFMADVFSSGQASRDFPLIAFGGMGGALLGPWLSGRLVYWLGIQSLLVVSAVALVGALLILMQMDVAERRQQPIPRTGAGEVGGSIWAGVTHTFSSPFLRNITLLMLFGDGVGTLAYAMLADYAKVHLPVLDDRVAFYSHVDLAANLIGAAMQLSISRWLLMRLGAMWGLMIPAMVNAVLLLGIYLAGVEPLQVAGLVLVPPAILMVSTRAMMYGMTKPASDSMYTRTSREDRYKSKNFIETTVWRIGDVAISSGVKALAQAGVAMTGVALFGVGVAVLGVFTAWRAGQAKDLLPVSERAQG
ncbi:NTP/NDP exchange transporter [Frateuria aurantia]